MTQKFSYQHFNPYSTWTVNKNQSHVYRCGRGQFITDTSTGDNYLNEDLGVIQFKCFLLALGTPIVHAMAALVKIMFNLLKLILLYDFWKSLDTPSTANKESYNLTQRSLDLGSTILNMIFAPVAVVFLELAAVYGVITPHNGRKLYASFERLAYGDSVLAPCFQPEPTKHLCGGDLKVANSF